MTEISYGEPKGSTKQRDYQERIEAERRRLRALFPFSRTGEQQRAALGLVDGEPVFTVATGDPKAPRLLVDPVEVPEGAERLV